jgi:hypothetical protein
MHKLLRFEQYSVENTITEKANTDLELKSVAKKIFSLLKSKGLKPQYQTGKVKLTNGLDCAISIEDGFIYIGIWDFALKKNKIDPGTIHNDIKKQLGDGFETRTKKDVAGTNEVIYRMQVRMVAPKK